MNPIKDYLKERCLLWLYFLLSFQYAFGLIYTELLSVYDQSNEQTSLIGSLQQACGLIFG